MATSAFPPIPGGSSIIMKNLLGAFDPGSMVLALHRSPMRTEEDRLFIPGYDVMLGFRRAKVIDQTLRRFQVPLAARRISNITRKHGCGAIVGVFPNIFMLDAACRAARQADLPFLPYVHDTIAESMQGGNFAAYARRVNRDVLKNAQHLIVATGGLEKFFHHKYGVYPTVVPHSFPESTSIFTDSSTPKRTVFWSGAVYSINDKALHRVFDAVKQIDYARLVIASAQGRESLSLLGFDGPRLDTHFFPARQRDDYLRFVRQQGVHVLALNWPDETVVHPDELSTILPTKTPEYLASGRPVLVHCPKGYFLFEFLHRRSCGEFVSAPSTDAVRVALEKLLTDRTRCERLGRLGQEVAGEFSLERVSRIFHGAIERALSNSAS